MISRTFFLLVAVLTGSAAMAAELEVQAPVVSVEPIAAADRTVTECPARPADGTLGATLRWDLGLTCSQRVVHSDDVRGYRVYYRWDNRIHSLVTASEPGDTVALRVRVN